MIFKKMESEEIRKKFLAFFEKRGHKIIPSASLVPENDPTTLFTGSGMQPLVPYLLGQKHPAGTRLADSQKCFRAEDMDEVGDNRHSTFFEMLGNWSLGDYWKEEQLGWFFEFLTKEAGIPKERLAVTCFEGDKKLSLPRDDESAKIWGDLGIPKERIFYYDARKNWWSRSGVPEQMPFGEPGGPDSEVFYEFTQVPHDKKFGERCHPNCDCGRFMEIGNSVFMEYRKKAGGFEKLAQKNVDFGGGLERIVAATKNNADIFAIDVFEVIIRELERLSGKSYSEAAFQKSFRVVADHVRAAVFLMADGVSPSNTEKGYFVRRLIRRAVRFGKEIGLANENYASLIEVVAEKYSGAYSLIRENKRIVENEFIGEVRRFSQTLEKGIKQFEKIYKISVGESQAKGLPAHVVFELVTTYGFPFDLVKEMAKERGLDIDERAFEREMEKHKELSRAGADKKFKGGLADTSDKVIQYHTATHLLHQALRDVLGPSVGQKGSNITAERLRFDFSFGRKMTPEEIKKVEEIVNEKIAAALAVNRVILPREEAEKTGALHFFGEKYGDQVSVYYIGDSLENAYSKEFCGGPHVANTGDLRGTFKITKEEAVSAGVRRIKADITS